MDENLYTDGGGGRSAKLSVSFNLPDSNGYGQILLYLCARRDLCLQITLTVLPLIPFFLNMIDLGWVFSWFYQLRHIVTRTYLFFFPSDDKFIFRLLGPPGGYDPSDHPGGDRPRTIDIQGGEGGYYGGYERGGQGAPNLPSNQRVVRFEDTSRYTQVVFTFTLTHITHEQNYIFDFFLPEPRTHCPDDGFPGPTHTHTYTYKTN